MNQAEVRALRLICECRPPEAKDPQIDGVEPSLVVEPDDPDALRRVMTVLHNHRLAAIPVGSGSRLELGNPPSRWDVLLSLKHLSGILEFEPTDLTVTVAAGTTLAELAPVLNGEGLYLPIEPAFGHAATLGGVFALGEWGSRRQPGARPRDLLVGFEAVLADGRAVKGGGRVVKNVAGYELTKLMVGSAGTLGVLTKLHLRVRAIPEVVALVHVRAMEMRDLLSSVEIARKLALGPEAIVVSSGSDRFDQRGAPSLWCRFEGLAEEVDSAVSGLETALESTIERGGSVELERLTDAAVHGPWQTLHQFPLCELPPRGVSFRLLSNPADAAMLADAGERAGGGEWVAFPETGLVYGRVEDESQWPPWRSVARERGAQWVVERASLETKTEDVYGELPAGFPLMRAIKQSMDPHGVLSPGRFVGRL